MKIPFKPAALSAAAIPLHMGRHGFANNSMPTLLISAAETIQLATYNSSGFDVVLNATVPGLPSWVEFVEPNKLYAVDEEGVDLRLYTLDLGGANNSEPHLSEEPIAQATGSKGVVHLEFNHDKTRMVGSGYTDGTIDIWDVSNDQLELMKVINSTGTTGPTERQDKSYPHEAVLEPSGRFFVVNDLGYDTIHVIDSEDDAFEIVSSVPTPAGCGPRHGVFHTCPDSSTGKATHYFVVCEVNNTVVSYSLEYTDDDLEFTQVQEISTFAGGETPENPTTGMTAAAAGEIVIDDDNENLYVSNRVIGTATDTIAHFRIMDGELGVPEESSTHSVNPRMFSISKNGKTLFSVNQKGEDAVVALSIDDDGSIGDELLASLPMDGFKAMMPPAYVKQIR